jgi:flagellar basal-body rod protein FlgF
MDPLTIAAAGGMRSRLDSLDLLANNIANADTGGYKVDREFYNLYNSIDAEDPNGPDPTKLPVIEKNYIDFSQGQTRVTANPTDFALQGKGFFAVDTPGGVAYTRNGSFQVSPAGVLTTSEGYAVRGDDGKPITIDQRLPMDVSADGTVTQSGQTVGRFAVVNFDNPQDLVKQGNTLFRAGAGARPQPSATAVQQGRLESSNASPAESAVRLVSVLRQYEMLQKAAHIGAEMNKQAIQDVARVG